VTRRALPRWVSAAVSAAGSVALVAGYLTTVVGANWAVHRYGIIPVGFGLSAPAGVYAAGLAFTLRDLVQDRLGRRGVLGAVIAGTAISAMISGRLALASGTGFAVSEVADFMVYTAVISTGPAMTATTRPGNHSGRGCRCSHPPGPSNPAGHVAAGHVAAGRDARDRRHERRWLAAVLASNTVGLGCDSLVFLELAFGSLDHLAGQVVGKAWMTLLAVAVLWGVHHRHAVLPGHP